MRFRDVWKKYREVVFEEERLMAEIWAIMRREEAPDMKVLWRLESEEMGREIVLFCH